MGFFRCEVKVHDAVLERRDWRKGEAEGPM